jgi:hypothetical protein
MNRETTYDQTRLALHYNLNALIEYVWADALRDYRDDPGFAAIFHDVVGLANWLNGGTRWTVDDYVTATERDPTTTYQTARQYATPAEASAPATRSAADDAGALGTNGPPAYTAREARTRRHLVSRGDYELVRFRHRSGWWHLALEQAGQLLGTDQDSRSFAALVGQVSSTWQEWASTPPQQRPVAGAAVTEEELQALETVLFALGEEQKRDFDARGLTSWDDEWYEHPHRAFQVLHELLDRLKLSRAF